MKIYLIALNVDYEGYSIYDEGFLKKEDAIDWVNKNSTNEIVWDGDSARPSYTPDRVINFNDGKFCGFCDDLDILEIIVK